MGIFFLAIVAPFKLSACFSGAKHSEGPPSLLLAESTASWSFPTVKMRWGLLKEVVCSRAYGLRGGTGSNFQKLGQWGTPNRVSCGWRRATCGSSWFPHCSLNALLFVVER